MLLLIKFPFGKLLAGVLSPNGQAIAMANVDKIIHVWVRDRPAPQILKGHQAEVWQVVFSPDSRFIASASGDNTAKLWTLDGKLLRTFVGHSATVWRVAFSPDGKMVATGSGDNTVKLWTLDGEPALFPYGQASYAQRLRQEKTGFPVAGDWRTPKGQIAENFHWS